MKIDGTYTFEAPRELVYDMLQDPEVLAKIVPGCEKLTRTGENEYEAALEINVGPVKGQFSGKVLLSDMQPPESYRMEISGKGVPGFVKGTGLVRLASQGDGTLLTYEGDAQVGGRIASVGQRLLESTARALTQQSLEGVNQHIQARVKAQNEKTEVAHVEIKAPSQVEFATGVAKGVVSDLVPPERRPILLVAGAVLLLLLIILIARGRSKKD